MIRHIVLWNVRGDTPEERDLNIRTLRDAFHGLRGRIPGMLHLEIGVDTSRVDYACDVALYSEFTSQAALDAYAIHPEHLRVKDVLGGIRTARYQADYAVQTDDSHELRFE